MSGAIPGVSGGARARGDQPGSLNGDWSWPGANSVEGAVVRARLARLRWALVDEVTMLGQVHRAMGGENAPHDAAGCCPATDLDIETLRRACRVLERLIQSP